MIRAAACALLVAATLAAGCKSKKKDDAGGEERTTTQLMSPAEMKRGQEACTTYVMQLCACAEQRPDDNDLKDRCYMKQGTPEGLANLYAVAADPKQSETSRLQVQVEARKIIAKCIEGAAQLPSLGCR